MAIIEISKKELLELTGISYGQLYRWKRKGIIPEDWFIKRASYTGQETYFPKEQILDRIDKILELKDIKSLEEIADIINGDLPYKKVTKFDLEKQELFINKSSLDLIDEDDIELNDLLVLKIVDNVMEKIKNPEKLKDLQKFLLQEGKDLTNNFKNILICVYDNDFEAFLLKENIESKYNANQTIYLNLETIKNNLKIIFM